MQIALAVVALLFVMAAGFVLAGVYILVGMAWTFLAAGLLLFGAAIHLRAGLKPNG